MERGMTADQMLRALWRRKALVGSIALAVFAVGAAGVLAQPSVYTATAVVRVEPQRPAEDMVHRTVSELVEQRLLTVRQELMARPVLEKAIREMNLYPETVSEDGMEAAVEAMRKDIEVRVEGENAFSLTVSSSDPETAQRVANRLPAVFAEETLKARQAQASRAVKLFDDELKQLSVTVADWEKKIAQFKVDHMGELPEQLEMNMRGLERTSAMMQTKSEELRVAEARRSDLARARNAADSEAGRFEAAENALNRQLVSARQQWTDDHPEIKRLESEAAGMTQKRKEAEGRMWAERAERARVADLISTIQGEIEGLQKQAQTYQQRMDNTPRWTHELSVLNRDYEITRTKYQSVLSRKVEAELAEQMEAASQKSLFNVISPADTPAVPARPDRFSGLIVAALVAIGLGMLVGVVLTLRDDSLSDQSEARERLPLPVLAVVPEMNLKGERRVLAPALPGARNQVSSPPTLN